MYVRSLQEGQLKNLLELGSSNATTGIVQLSTHSSHFNISGQLQPDDDDQEPIQ
jgi:hypothetical protein